MVLCLLLWAGDIDNGGGIAEAGERGVTGDIKWVDSGTAGCAGSDSHSKSLLEPFVTWTSGAEGDGKGDVVAGAKEEGC